MNYSQSINYFIIFKTLIRREVRRIFRIWIQTLLPPFINTGLYFLIFGELLGSQIGKVLGHPYGVFITPGLMILTILTSAYNNVVFSIFTDRFQRSIEQLFIAPIPFSILLGSYIAGGVIRGLLTAMIVSCVPIILYGWHALCPVHPIMTFATMILACILFSLLGFTNGLFAKRFDDLSLIPSFILTPLTYLGGTFYSIQNLPPIWEKISHYNPIFHLVNLLRYSMLGMSDLSTPVAFPALLTICIIFALWNLMMLRKKIGFHL